MRPTGLIAAAAPAHAVPLALVASQLAQRMPATAYHTSALYY